MMSPGGLFYDGSVLDVDGGIPLQMNLFLVIENFVRCETRQTSKLALGLKGDPVGGLESDAVLLPADLLVNVVL